MPPDADTLRSLANRLDGLDPREFHVVCLPDFFLDHFVELPPWEDAVAEMARIHAQGGGNLQRVAQRFSSGGNAANTALALARLGVRAHLIARTSAFGGDTLRSSLGGAGVDLSRMKTDGELAITTALEFGPARRNVMLSNAGSVADFRFEDLDDNDLTLIEGSDAVLVANWAQCVRGGTGLVSSVARLAAKSGTISYVDTGDPSGRLPDVPTFVDDVLTQEPIGVLALNENELAHYAGARATDRSDVLASGTTLAERLKGGLDLHTSGFAAAWTNGNPEPAVVETFAVTPRRATGAGDAWNAGNLLGHMAGFEPAERLAAANALAAHYISSPEGRHPNLRDLAEFVRARA